MPIDTLLTAHSIMMHDLTDEVGCFRSRPVGVVNQQGEIVHFGTLPDYAPKLVYDLLDWTRDSDLPMLIKSCVFHYEFELVHPFSDGNGCMGRLWHILLLSKWNPLFAWLPIESIIHDHTQEDYEAINISNDVGESTAFILFMLSSIKSSLTEAMNMQDEMIDDISPNLDRRWEIVCGYLKAHGTVQNKDICRLLGISSATASRLLCSWVKEEKLGRYRNGKTWAYKSQ